MNPQFDRVKDSNRINNRGRFSYLESKYALDRKHLYLGA